MARVAMALGLLALGCAAHTPTPYEQAEQFVVGTYACLPPWVSLSAIRAPLHGQWMFAVATSPGTFGVSPEELDCVERGGGDCSRIRHCLGIELFVDARCETGGTACVGDTITTCIPGDLASGRPAVRSTYDCQHDGEACDPSTNTCLPPTCVPADPGTCDGDTIVTRCRGLEARYTCDPGTHCTSPPAECHGLGAPCVDDGCDGEQLYRCDHVTQRAMPIANCVDFGAHCGRDDIAVRCIPDASECGFEGIARCEGDALVYCSTSGVFVTYDCAAHGFGPCVVDTETARCTAAGASLF